MMPTISQQQYKIVCERVTEWGGLERVWRALVNFSGVEQRSYEVER